LAWRILAFLFAAMTACEGFAWKSMRRITQWPRKLIYLFCCKIVENTNLYYVRTNTFVIWQLPRQATDKVHHLKYYCSLGTMIACPLTYVCDHDIQMTNNESHSAHVSNSWLISQNKKKKIFSVTALST
jgi:hypothetical protein